METAVVAFTTFFATIGPLDVGPVFAAMTPAVKARDRRRMAVRGTLIATVLKELELPQVVLLAPPEYADALGMFDFHARPHVLLRRGETP